MSSNSPNSSGEKKKSSKDHSSSNQNNGASSASGSGNSSSRPKREPAPKREPLPRITKFSSEWNDCPTRADKAVRYAYMRGVPVFSNTGPAVFSANPDGPAYKPHPSVSGNYKRSKHYVKDPPYFPPPSSVNTEGAGGAGSSAPKSSSTKNGSKNSSKHSSASKAGPAPKAELEPQTHPPRRSKLTVVRPEPDYNLYYEQERKRAALRAQIRSKKYDSDSD